VAGEAGRVGPSAPQVEINHFKHAIQISIDVVIPKSQNSEVGLR
jgi:hypothetical protein